MPKIKIVGVGPGSASCLTYDAAKAIREAGVVVGGKRHIENFALKGQEKYLLGKNLSETVDLINNFNDKQVTILATGDPGLFGILKFLLKYFKPEDIEVIPGVSSVQLAFARLSMSWDDAVIFSAHGRPANKMAEVLGDFHKAAILTGTDNTPEKIFEMLKGLDKNFYLCFDLSLPSEEIVMLQAGDSYPDELKYRYNCVMVIVNE